jgi:replicative DNA helicase
MQAVGGLILGGRKLYSAVCAKLRPEHFEVRILRSAYVAIGDIIAGGEDVSPVKVVGALVAGGEAPEDARDTVNAAMDAVVTTEFTRQYAEQVTEGYKARKVREIAGEIVVGDTVQPEIVTEVLPDIIARLTALTEVSDGSRSVPMSAAVDGWYEDFYGKPDRNAIHTGFKSLDGILGGIHETDYVLIGARPGVGKSAFANSFVFNAACQRRRVLYITLEMSQSQVLDRLFAMCARIPLSCIRAKDPVLRDEGMGGSLKTVRSGLANMDIFINDSGCNTVGSVIGEAIATRADLVVIDYIQLMRGRGDGYPNRNAELEEVSRELRQFALKNHVPIVALAQLNRSMSDRPDLVNLKDCGALEQDATAVFFMWEESESPEDKTANIVFDVRKNRQGETDNTVMRFKKSYMTFEELNYRHEGRKQKRSPIEGV